MNAIANTDALTYLRSLPPASIDCVVTSPPYFRLRDYGVDAQIGMEDTPDAYITRLMEVFDAAHAALKDAGTCWVNIGDSYANDGKWGGTTGGKHARALHGKPIGRRRVNTGLPEKSLMLIPFRFALAMQERGWIVRSDIVWAKGNPMPESVRDRPTRSHEYVFLLTKQTAYYYDADAIAEPTVDDRGRQPYGARGTMGHGNLRKQDQVHRRDTGFNDRYQPRAMRNRRDVWTINPKPMTDWIENVRRHPVSIHELSGGTKRIASPDCPVHGSKDRPGSTHECDEREAGDLTRNADIYAHLVQAQEAGFVPTVQIPASGLSEESSDDNLVAHAFSATDHSTQTHRRDHDPATTLPCTPSEEIASRTDDKSASPASVAPHENTPVNNTSQDGKIDHSLHQTEHGTVGILSSVSLPCTCQFYRETTEKTSHFATMPERLAELMILAGCPVGGVVCDPFMGSGTTALAARKLGRRYAGCELNPDYYALALRRLAESYTVVLPERYAPTQRSAVPLPATLPMFALEAQ